MRHSRTHGVQNQLDTGACSGSHNTWGERAGLVVKGVAGAKAAQSTKNNRTRATRATRAIHSSMFNIFSDRGHSPRGVPARVLKLAVRASHGEDGRACAHGQLNCRCTNSRPGSMNLYVADIIQLGQIYLHHDKH